MYFLMQQGLEFKFGIRNKMSGPQILARLTVGLTNITVKCLTWNHKSIQTAMAQWKRHFFVNKFEGPTTPPLFAIWQNAAR